MKFKISLEKKGEEDVFEEREISIRLSGQDQLEFMRKVKGLAKAATSEDTDPMVVLDKLEEFAVGYLNGLIAKKAKLSDEEVLRMDLEDKEKIVLKLKSVLLPGGGKGFF